MKRFLIIAAVTGLGMVGVYYIGSNKVTASLEGSDIDTTFLNSIVEMDTLRNAETEKHLKNVKQLTFGGDNAEAYFSFDNKMLTLQVTNPAWGLSCDQIFLMDLANTPNPDKELPMISNGRGRTTCSYFMPGNQEIIFASTFMNSDTCPQTPHIPGKYLWAVYETFDIYIADLEGNIIKRMTDTPGYDAEPTVSPKGDKIVFTSTRNGDLDLYTMNIDGTDVKQVTFGLGYDGGAFFTPDGTKLIFRASRPQTTQEKEEYIDLLKQGLVAPADMELYTCNVDGSDLKQITHLGKANWAPFMHPSGNKVIFSSNHHSEGGYDFQLYMINLDGTGLEQITTESRFNAFPMFSFDGKKIVFSSNRHNGGTRETNVFIADWVE